MSGESPQAALGAFLSGTEARQLADHIEAGETLSQALVTVSASRRNRVRELLSQAGLGVAQRDATVGVLRGIQGALGQQTHTTTVWTVPDGQVALGELTSSVFHLVERACTSVTCATFNLTKTSRLWHALIAASRRPDLDVRLYLDSRACDKPLTPREVSQRLSEATVLATRNEQTGARYVRSHAKILVIDHRWLIVTSANLSASAERYNVELGLRVDDRIAAEQVERQLRLLEGSVYDVVPR